MKLFDSLTNFVNGLANKRNAIDQNAVTAHRIDDVEVRAIMRTGLGSKILRIKAGYALDDTLEFDNTEDEKFYELRMARAVKKAARLSVAFGRSIIIILDKDGNLTKPLPKELNPATTRIEVFSGDMVTVPTVSIDLTDPRYLKPMMYMVRGQVIHHTRVIDFKYVEPAELDAPTYRYGGVSEFELIRPQLIADGIVQRAVPSILEKNSSFFYKVTGFKDALQSKQADSMVEYFTRMEDQRSIYGAGIVDMEDDVTTVDQSLTNLSDADSITLRRLAMVTGIPMTVLVGENARGLNATGDSEQSIFQDMIETLQSEYLIEPINELMRKFGKGIVIFKDNQGQTPNDRLDVETKVIANAEKLALIGEDYTKYLQDHGLSQKDKIASFFESQEESESGEMETLAALIAKSQSNEA